MGEEVECNFRDQGEQIKKEEKVRKRKKRSIKKKKKKYEYV
jgi:hypothetical protein